MRPWTQASRLLTLDDRSFVFANEHDRVVIPICSSQELNQLLQQTREIVAYDLAWAKREAACHMAAEIDERYLAGRLVFREIAHVCRDLGQRYLSQIGPKVTESDGEKGK